MPRSGRTCWLAMLAVLAACSNGSGSLEEGQGTPPASQPGQSGLTIGGSVSGLTGTGLVLQNNGSGDLTVASDGSFTFANTASTGAAYNVTVLTQPTSPAQTCTVANGVGTLANANITNISVTCTDAPRYTVSGAVTGLTGAGLVLQNNGGDNLTISRDGVFTFATALLDAAAYNVTVSAQPNGQNCAVRNATGNIAAANVANIEVSCVVNQFTVGGEVTGLAGTGFVLRLNGANDLSIVNNGRFTFPATLSPSAAYAVTVMTQPSNPTQECTLTNPSGTIVSANVTNIAIACRTSSFAVGGTVAGLAGSGLVLQLNDANDLPLLSNGSFSFPPVLSGTTYTVRVKDGSQPTGPVQRCTVANARGTVGAQAISNIQVTCATEAFSIGGTVIGLVGAPLVLQNNLGDDLTIAANGAFTFATRVASGGAYSVTVREGSAPVNPTQACSITNGSGTVGVRAIENIVVSCSTSNFTIGGTVQNLVGSGLVLRNNGNDSVTLNSGAATFAFPDAIASGASFDITVAQQPTNPNQTCTVTPGTGSGTVGSTNVTSVDVQCVTDGFTIGGNVAGLVNAGLSLTNNRAETLQIAANGTFRFATPLLPGSQYFVEVATQPALQLCFVTGGTGTVTAGNVESVQVTCF